ncbi:unnamed protein product [Musa acuminata subsp. malaccensis]|uniref:(wild Malaysian banana) hypothetical protein n=1 Tax=Musa acuminata subsp. malaccensis TaxID=214687 RepID=A0A8D7F0F0_MUSAM|nr:unnamed protein product [Musa acuminata subsp. malaccensis]
MRLEGELGDKKYFGGDAFGFVDVALVPFVPWFYTYETCAGFSVEEVAQAGGVGQAVHGKGERGQRTVRPPQGLRVRGRPQEEIRS